MKLKKMIKKTSLMILSLLMICGLVTGQTFNVSAASGQDGINIIKERLKEYFLGLDTIDDGSKVETCYVSKASDYLALIREDGSFADVDYNAHNNAANGVAWSPYLAIDRLQAIAIAYHKEGNVLYQSEAAKNGVDKALKHWVTQGSRDNKPGGPYSSNWWENEVGVQLRFARIGLFMEGVISNDAFKVITDKLIEKTPLAKGTGQNNLWFDQNHVYHALLTNNLVRLKEMVDDYLNYCLSTQLDDKTDEAVQVDNSFYMHGRQFYSNGYGMSMFRDMSFWIYMLRETDFAIGDDVVDRMADYMLDGTSWTIRGDIMELYLGYRPYKLDVGYKNYAEEYIEPLKRMIVADPDRASRYQTVLENIEGKNTSNGKSGNYYMWRSGYASHMRDNYGVNIKMDSKDIIGGEWRGSWPAGQDQGQLIYWTSSSTSTITVDGDEYTNVFPTYDWAHCPGSTTANRIVKDYANYGRFTNGTEHTIGVSNEKYGTTAYVMDKKNTQATKGYFFFDDEFVALGAGINSKEEVNIHTTLNQSEASNVTVGGQAVTEGTKAKEYTTNWLYNDKVGYVMPKESKVVVSNTKQTDLPSLWADKQKSETPATFSAWMDHGLNPINGSYEYIVVPGKTASEVEQYSSNIPVTIVSNTKDVQAVRHDGLKQTQINFYKAGTLEYAKGKTITVDQPCNIIIDESKSTPVISLAVADTDSGKAVKVKLNIGGTQSETQFVVGQAPYAGQTVTLETGQTNAYTASSYADGHLPIHAYDKDSNTYWKSETGENQWIVQALGKRTFISTMSIDWKDNFAKKYKVQISTDGINFTDVATTTNGDGGKDEVSIFSIATHVKIVCEESNKSAGYEIAEIAYKGGTNIALDKKVQASSTSTNDPGNVARNAVDGNTATRWSSLRDSHNEWITVDLGGKAKVDAIRVLWEGARSVNYTVDISDDAKTWKTLKTVKESNVLLDEILLSETAEGRYLRINSTESKVTSKNYGISIYELEVYGEVDLSSEELANVAIGKSASASSINSTDAPERSIDGNLSTFWKSDLKTDHYLNIFLKDIHTISKVAINWGGVYLDSYKIEVSNDNSNWKTIETIAKCNGNKETINFNEAVDAKYIRIIGNTATEKNVVINEFEVFGVLKEESKDVNLALNKPSQASSEYLDTKDGNKLYKSSLAFDGNTAKVNNQQSRWSSNRESNNEWIQVDLEDIYLIDSVVLNWEGTSVHDYKVLVSKDNKNWQEVKHINTGSGIKEITFENPVEGRYVKVQGVKVGGKYGYSLWEFEVYGKKEVFKNVALNKESKASSEYLDTKDGNKIYKSSLAFDGSTAKVNNQQSRWTSNRDSNSEWIYVDLGLVHDVYSVILNWEGTSVHDYKLLVSKDNVKWDEVEHINTGSGIKEITFNNPIEARYVKVEGIKVGGKYGYSLWEFEVYGKSMKTDLDNLYKKLKDTDSKLYTPKSYKAFKDNLDKALEVIENLEAKEADIKAILTALDNSYNDLVLLANRKVLEAEIKKAEAINTKEYTPKSIKVFSETLLKVKEIYANKDATQKEVDEAKATLTSAISSLVKKADKAKLVELIKQVNNLKESEYTEDSFKNVIAEKTKAQKVIDDENATDKQVADTYNSLKAVLDKLAKKPTIDVEPDDKPSTEDKVIGNKDQTILISGQLPKEAELTSKVLNEKEIELLKEKMNPEFFKTASLEKVYDLGLLLNGAKYNPDGTVTVTLKLEDSYRNKNIGIIYIDDNGNITKLSSTKDKDYIKFDTTHFSTYAIVSYNEVNNDGVGENGKVEVPKTSDNSYVYLYATLVTVSLGYLIFRKRKSYVRNKK